MQNGWQPCDIVAPTSHRKVVFESCVFLQEIFRLLGKFGVIFIKEGHAEFRKCPPMEESTYKSIIKTIRDHRGLSRNCYAILLEQFPEIPDGTLCSILSLQYQKRMKMNHVKTPAVVNMYHDLYSEALKRREQPGIILRIAQDSDVTPCLVAKLILQKHFEINNSAKHSKINVNKYLRDTTLIDDADLAYEIFLCTLYDDLYSPLVETMKSSIGQQYEIQLHKEMKQLGLAFRDEEYLRKFGYDKTPDFKLEVPVAIDGFIIHWIESKALFGDKVSHQDYIKSQYSSYWNRFGPGLVIYWFGYLKTINQPSDKRFIVKDHLPTNIVYINEPNA